MHFISQYCPRGSQNGKLKKWKCTKTGKNKKNGKKETEKKTEKNSFPCEKKNEEKLSTVTRWNLLIGKNDVNLIHHPCYS